MTQPEPWLRGPVEDVTAGAQPVAHALLYAREQLEKTLAPLTAEQVWKRPGNVASIGYHVRHAMGSIDRMLTYLRGQSLSRDQLEALQAEKEDLLELDGAALLQHALPVIDGALSVVKTVSEDQLDDERKVGRKQLPSDVRGLLFEIAVHTARHVGQIATTSKLV